MIDDRGPAMADDIPGLLFTNTASGELEWVSRATGDYFGKTLAELRLWPTTEWVHPEDLPATLVEWTQGVESGEPYEIEHRLRRFDGVYRWFHLRVVPSRDERNRVIRWYGVLSDIDDLKRAQETARLSERNLRLFLERMPGLVYTMTPNCELELVNSRVLEYFGGTFEQLKNWQEFGSVHPDDMPLVIASRKRTIEFGEPHEVEQRLRRADGAYRWFKPHSLTWRDAEGRILRWYCVLTDIDDRKRAEEESRNLQARLSRASHFAAVSQLAASIAHEVNQPLAAVVANGHACRRWLSSEPASIERALLSVERIIRDGNSAADVISRVRSLFRQAPPIKQLLNLNEVIEEVCRLLAEDFRDKAVRLNLDLSSNLPRVAADRVQMQQVVSNLTRNGIEAMDAVSAEQRELSISSALSGGEVVVYVTDVGAGVISPDAVFEAFYTTKTSGMGMGLSICRSILEAHGGRLWVAQKSPPGATFAFALPTGDAPPNQDMA